MSDWVVTKQATIKAEGSKKRECSGCEYQQTEAIPKLPHTHEYSDWKYSSSYHWKECSCGNKIDETSHTFGGWVVTKEPTENMIGSRRKTCTECSYFESQTMPVALKIVTQPKSKNGPLNKSSATNNITADIAVSGGQKPYSFKWEKKVNNNWVKASQDSHVYEKSNIFYNYDDARGVQTFRCVVTDSFGYTVTSNEFTHTWYNKPVFNCSTSYSGSLKGTITVNITYKIDDIDPNWYTYIWWRRTCPQGGSFLSYGTDNKNGTVTLKLSNDGFAESYTIYCDIEGHSNGYTYRINDVSIRFS